MLITKHSPDDVTIPWREEDHQAYIVTQLRRYGVLFRVGMEGIKLTQGQAMKAKALGMEAGEPDILIYGKGGSVLLIELKRFKGVLSDKQKDRIAKLGRGDHMVSVIKEKTPLDAWNRLLAIVSERGFVW